MKNRPEIELRAGKDKKLDFLQKVMRKCWEQDPSDRPFIQSVLEEMKDFMTEPSFFTLQTDLV